MSKQSAGLIMYRKRRSTADVLLVHPGGPFWAKKDLGAWSIPKGEIEEAEEPLAAAMREFFEETAFIAQPPFLDLGSIKQQSGKTFMGWAFAGDCDPSAMVSTTFRMEWPPRSGKLMDFPEADRANWFPLATAGAYLVKGQAALLDRLSAALGLRPY